MDFTAIDFEKGNNSMLSVCAVGICVVRNNIIEHEEYRLVRPPKQVNRFTRRCISINGIRPEDVIDKPNFSSVWRDLSQYFYNTTIVAHGLADADAIIFDALSGYYHLGFKIDYEHSRHICTYRLAQYAQLPELNGKFSLSEICQTWNIPLDHHDPLSDARASALILMKLSKKLHKGLPEMQKMIHRPEFLRLSDIGKIKKNIPYYFPPLPQIKSPTGEQIDDIAYFMKRANMPEIKWRKINTMSKANKWIEEQAFLCGHGHAPGTARGCA